MPAAVRDDVTSDILRLKSQIGATILAHDDRDGELPRLAGITGDSLKLARC